MFPLDRRLPDHFPVEEARVGREDMTEIEYERAPLGGVARFRLTDDRIEELDASGNAKRGIALADLRHIRWQETYAKRMMLRSLDLSGSGGRLSLAQTAAVRAAPREQLSTPYLHGIRAVLTRVSEARPDLSIEQGAPAGLRWFYFILLIVLGGVLLIPLNGVLNHRRASELWWLAAALGGCVVLSLFFAWLTAPWKPGPRVSPRELLASLGRK